MLLSSSTLKVYLISLLGGRAGSVPSERIKGGPVGTKHFGRALVSVSMPTLCIPMGLGHKGAWASSHPSSHPYRHTHTHTHSSQILPFPVVYSVLDQTKTKMREKAKRRWLCAHCLLRESTAFGWSLALGDGRLFWCPGHSHMEALVCHFSLQCPVCVCVCV